MGDEKVKNYLEIKNINKSYEKDSQKKLVLKNINLNISKNEFITLLGPSGCGKSTLLKIIGGFLNFDSGDVYKNSNKIKGADLDRIMVFQEFEQLFPWKTVMGNVIFALKAANKSSDINFETTAKDYLKKVQLEDYYDYYPHHLSGGMKQRAALARTFAAKSEILLMDEPFGSLDSLTRHSLQSLLIKIWKNEQRTIIFVTHDIREAIYLSDKIVLMDNNPGRIKEIIKNKLSRPRDRTDNNFSELYKEIYHKMS
jgi:NitT/TauT family transport system ATP-binding protein